MRTTEKRNKILELFTINHLLTASEVCDLLPNIDRATIYRNLNTFVETGKLKEVNIKKGISSYELNKENDTHQHFICTKCKQIFSFNIDFKLLKTIIPSNFKFNEFELNLKGLCANCKSE